MGTRNTRHGGSAPWLRRHAPHVVFLVALALGAYSNTFNSEFVFDDREWIVDNPVIRDLRHYLLERTGYDQHPNRFVANLTFALNYAIGGLDPSGYHVANLCVHVANALLVYALTILLFKTPLAATSRIAQSSRAIAFVASALFVAHPLQTQAVSYVVQRLTSLATTFYLLAVVLYLAWRVREDPSTRSRLRALGAYAAVVVSIVLAMKTKEIAFTLPLALAACELWFFPITRQSALRLLPLIATLAVIPATLIDFAKPLDEIASQLEKPIPQVTLPRAEYWLTQLAVITTYLRLLIFPVGQNADPDYPTYRSLSEPRLALAALVIACLGAAAWLTYRWSSPGGRGDGSARVISFGIVWYFLAVSVESLVPLPDVMFEHRAYLPSVGLFIAVAVAAAWLSHVHLRGRAAAVVTAVAVALPIALAAATFNRNEVWNSGVTLWTDAAAKSPNKLRPHYNLGEALGKKGDVDGAIQQYILALQVAPMHPESHNNLGVAYYGRGRVDDSIAHLRTAISVKPDYAEAHLNLGIAYGDKGWLAEAQEEMSIGMRLQASAKRGP